MTCTRPLGPKNGLLGLSHLKQIRDDVLRYSVELADRFGDCVYYRVGPVPIYQFTHPDQVHEVLVARSKSFGKPAHFKKALRRWNGNGLLVNEGKPWARQRRLVQKAFHPRRLRDYADLTVRHAHTLIDECGSGDVNIAAALSRLTLRTTVEALFGNDAHRVIDRFGDEIEVLQDVGYRDLTSPVLLPTWAPTPRRRRLRQSLRFIDGFIGQLIRERRQHGVADRSDLLSVLLAAVDDEEQTGMSDQQARDESFGLLLGGTETTATALTWCLYLMATHPAQQQDVVKEVNDVLAGQAPTFDDIHRLPRVEAAFNEAIRLYPPAYAISRMATEEVTVGGFRVPRGAQVHVVPYITQRDGRWFDDPTTFYPDRFNTSDDDQIRPLAFYPFGAGPRACVGKGFAMAEAVLVLATILSSHTVEVADGQGAPEAEARVSLHPKGGIRLRLVRRHDTPAMDDMSQMCTQTTN